ncbi:MAG: hypothetical protein WEA36_04020 [Balneolaceae bacterium]
MLTAMEKRSDHHFSYPSNIHELDLATMVTMYRSRGEPRNAGPGDYLACAHSHQLLKEGKWWFGLYYGQRAWDSLLTNGSEGYPLTEVELQVLGLASLGREDPFHRDFIEKNSGTIPKLAYLVINDLKQFGFLDESDEGLLHLTSAGDKALFGISRRIYRRSFSDDMLTGLTRDAEDVLQGSGKGPTRQATLF